jgi:hypothetical protein
VVRGNWSRGPTVSMRSVDSSHCCSVMLCLCRARNAFLNNFWNRTIFLCMPSVCVCVCLYRYMHYERWAGQVARMGEKRNAYRLLMGKPEGKRPLGWPRRRWVDNIRMDLGEVGWGYVDWIGLAKDKNRWRAVVNSVLNFRVPWNAGKLSSGLASGGLSSSAQLHRVS